MNLIFKKEAVGVWLLLSIVLLFSFSFVSAVPPSQGTSGVLGLQVEFPKLDFFEFNRSVEFNFHVFNLSTGLRLDNTSTTCFFHLFNSSGEHLFPRTLIPYDSQNLDFQITVLNTNFTKLGDYYYETSCNTTAAGGFISVPLEITNTGQATNNNFYYLILILSLGIIIFGLSIKDPAVTILGSFGFYFVGFYIFFNGIVGINDLVTTRSIALIVLFLAAYISVRSAFEWVKDE